MENEKISNCNQCPNHCPADALQCGRGRYYFEQLGNPDAGNASEGKHYGHSEGHHERGGGHQHSRGHGESDDLYGLMRACGHYLHHSGGKKREEGGENQLFAALNEAEQESLKGLLRKLMDNWDR